METPRVNIVKPKKQGLNKPEQNSKSETPVFVSPPFDICFPNNELSPEALEALMVMGAGIS